jgi:hypothetical protein
MASTMQAVVEKLDSLTLKRKEADRLLNTLRYYAWLEEVGLSWSEIRGVASTFKGPAWKMKRLVSYKLSSGKVVEKDWPPFDDAVIYNRSYIEE